MSRLLAELSAHTALVLIAVLLVLIGGQLAQIGDLLWSAGSAAPWLAVIGRGALILLEAALPLAGLVGAGLVYGRLRSEAGWIAHAALGGHPLVALWPALLVGGLLGLGAAGLAHGVVPGAVVGLRGDLVAAAGAALAVPDRAVPLPGGGVARREPGGAWWAVVPHGRWGGRGAGLDRETGRGAGLDREAGRGAGLDRAAGDPTDDPPLLVRAGSARIAGDQLLLDDARLWSPTLRIRVGTVQIPLDADPLARRLGMFGPPNATPTAELDPTNVHHRFTAHRRSALPAMAPLWALLGALLGARAGGAIAVAGGAVAVGAGYWLLRTGELSARAGFMSPVLAAWAPALLLALALAWALHRDASLARPG